jgi:plastocyanin
LDNVVTIQRDDKWDPRRKKYFHPRFARVLSGQQVMWINHDTKNHRLVSGNPDTLISDGIFDTGEILVGQTSSIQFNSSQRAKSKEYTLFLRPSY